MSALLLDTSVWIEYLRDTGSRACQEVARLLEEPSAIVTSPPIVMELLAGATSDAALAQLEQLTAALPVLRLDQDTDFHAAARAYRLGRQRGLTVRGHVDCLLAVVAQRTGAVLVHRDGDLEALAGCLRGLSTHDLR